MYQVVEGIVKVLGNYGGEETLGVADGKGLFIWVKDAMIKGSFPPKPYAKWQTTRFLLPLDYKVNWKPEKNWDQYKSTYTADNILPLPRPIPAEYALESMFQPQVSLPNQNVPVSTGNVSVPSRSVLVASNDSTTLLNHILTELRAMSTNIHKLLGLWQKYMNEPELTTADNLYVKEEVVSEADIVQEYGEPPEEDELPEVF